MKRTATRKKAAPRPPFRIQLVIDPHLGYWRELILGARQYGFETGRIEFADRWLAHEPPDLRALIRRDEIQGLIAAIHRATNESKFCALPVPVVNVSNNLLLPRLPVVTQDDPAVGRLAALHLRDLGCHRFVFWGQAQGRYSRERLAGFQEALADAGVSIDIQESRLPHGRKEYERILRWLELQKPPLGIFAVHDNIALLVLRAARQLSWRVPGDLAVLGVDDDEFLVAFERTPLSSIRLPARKTGYEAAAEIDRLICGGPSSRPAVRIPPVGLVVRQSTDTSFVTDEAVARAVHFIRENALASPYVTDVARAAGVSRSSLHARFRAALGCSVLEEIQRVRLERAKSLLRSTSLKLDAIAEKCGFSSYQRFIVLFRQKTGVSPGRFRQNL